MKVHGSSVVTSRKTRNEARYVLLIDVTNSDNAITDAIRYGGVLLGLFKILMVEDRMTMHCDGA